MSYKGRLKKVIKKVLGELAHLDFIKAWPTLSEIAKHILSLANSGGGCIIIGVSETNPGELKPDGLNRLIDKSDLAKGLEDYLSQDLEYDILDVFSSEATNYRLVQDKNFQVLLVEDKPEYLPFVSKCESNGIEKDTVYIRRGTDLVSATFEEIQDIVNRRVDTGNFFDL